MTWELNPGTRWVTATQSWGSCLLYPDLLQTGSWVGPEQLLVQVLWAGKKDSHTSASVRPRLGSVCTPAGLFCESLLVFLRWGQPRCLWPGASWGLDLLPVLPMLFLLWEQSCSQSRHCIFLLGTCPKGWAAGVLEPAAWLLILSRWPCHVEAGLSPPQVIPRASLLCT